jgi:predicted nucleotidyltransferase
VIILETRIKNLLHDVEKELKALFGGKLFKVILYGSYARGDYDYESDIDIIALIDEDDLKKYEKQILRINVDLSIEYDADLSIVIENKTDFDLNFDIIPLYKNIGKEGINIYAA